MGLRSMRTREEDSSGKAQDAANHVARLFFYLIMFCIYWIITGGIVDTRTHRSFNACCTRGVILILLLSALSSNLLHWGIVHFAVIL